MMFWYVVKYYISLLYESFDYKLFGKEFCVSFVIFGFSLCMYLVSIGVLGYIWIL